MNILITMEDGTLFQLDKNVDVNEVARFGATPGDIIIYRFLELNRIPDNIKDWDYKTDQEIRELLDNGRKITFVEEYPDMDDDFFMNNDDYYDDPLYDDPFFNMFN